MFLIRFWLVFLCWFSFYINFVVKVPRPALSASSHDQGSHGDCTCQAALSALLPILLPAYVDTDFYLHVRDTLLEHLHQIFGYKNNHFVNITVSKFQMILF